MPKFPPPCRLCLNMIGICSKGIQRWLASVTNTGTVLVPFGPRPAPQQGLTSNGTARPRLVRLETHAPAGVCHARGRPMTPPKPVKVIALMTLLIGVALMLAALLY